MYPEHGNNGAGGGGFVIIKGRGGDGRVVRPQRGIEVGDGARQRCLSYLCVTSLYLYIFVLYLYGNFILFHGARSHFSFLSHCRIWTQCRELGTYKVIPA